MKKLKSMPKEALFILIVALIVNFSIVSYFITRAIADNKSEYFVTLETLESLDVDSLALEIHAEAVELSYDSNLKIVSTATYIRGVKETIENFYIGGIIDEMDVQYMCNKLKVEGIVEIDINTESLKENYILRN